MAKRRGHKAGKRISWGRLATNAVAGAITGLTPPRTPIYASPRPRITRSRPGRSSTRKKLFARGRPDGMGGSYSFCKLKSKKKSIIKNISKVLPRNVLSATTAGRITTTFGKQGVGTTSSILDGTDLTNIMNQAGATGSDTTHVNLTGVTSGITFTNQDKGNCELTIYDLVARKDATGADIRTPQYTFTTGLSQANTTGSFSAVDSSNLGVTPFSSQMFCQFYKIKKVTKILMGQGVSHVHRVKYNLARKFDNSFISPILRVGGLTYYCLVVVRGMPYNDTVTKTQVASGSCAIDYVADIRYTYNFIQANRQQIQYYNGQGTIVNESIMDIGSGEAEVDVQA